MKILKYILLLFVGVSITSCNDFLDEKQKSNKDITTAFSKKEDAYAAVNILYRKGLPSFYNAGSAYVGPYIFYGGYRTGLFENEYAGQHLFNSHIYNMTIDSGTDDGELRNLWRLIYEAITRNANFAIEGIKICPGLTDKERGQLMAEAKFFRALNYFYLVKNFGEIPLVTKPVTSLSDDIYPRRSSIKLIYDFIVKDLLDALNEGELDDKAMPMNNMRISKGSVQALLADVYLNMAGYPILDESKYTEAAKIAKQIISNPNYELIKGKDNQENSVYNILRTSDKETEYLYQIEYLGNISQGGWYPVYGFPYSFVSEYPNTLKYSITCSTYNPVEKLLKIYDSESDLRIQEGQYFHTEWNGMPLVKSKDKEVRKYPHFFIEEEALENSALSSKDRVVYRTAEMYLIFAEADVLSKNSVTQEAVSALATVQSRASLTKSKQEIETMLAQLNKDDFVKEVWRERIRELMFECKIWNDVTRTRKYPDLTADPIDFIEVIGATTPYNATFQEKDLLYPYPRSEMERNPELTKEPITK